MSNLKTLHVGGLWKSFNVLKWGLSISDVLIIVLLFLFVNKIDPSFIDGSTTFLSIIILKESEKQTILIIYHMIFYLSIISQIFSIYYSRWTRETYVFSLYLLELVLVALVGLVCHHRCTLSTQLNILHSLFQFQLMDLLN